MTPEQILYELIEEFHIGDFVYDVKEREGNGWDGPPRKQIRFPFGASRETL